ncbi:DNA-3-methyladenine glycosylase [Fodinibius sediminis]|uniref:Putative 3-methyladenine DNA glycosylase n=1 Tax=Fodinibius sediminis TaxID=1214077 RepID=A0A521ANP4_9BACT|nr:DNA-3-methyladenine glycosylase [Fodinibius sediminis]SMO36437.1 DNA-3-methyladenine glycosylase [Fodinibius sediminis]
MSAQKLSPSFYRRPDVVQISRELIGKVLCTRVDGRPLTSGIITETEAYCGRNDRASHAYNGRRTDRTETMFRTGGIAYVYLCYGIHHLFNVVTNHEGQADAVLIRAIKPLEGESVMQQRRNGRPVAPALTAGPGRLSQALHISKDDDGTDLTGDAIWIEDRGIQMAVSDINAACRIGVDYAGEDARLPWRHYVEGSRWVSTK